MKFGVAFLLWLPLAKAEKDSTYYPDGMENPNVEDKMYWADAINVLEDISKFDALYVTHHGCTWSEYEDQEDNGGGCNYQGAINEESWYMGLSPCYRANTAFSLYGILKGEKDTGCNAKTFINSFFTSRGVETFTEYMAYAGVSFTAGADDDNAGGVSSACEVVQNDDAADANDDGGYAHNYNLGAGYSSYGLGCSAEGSYMEKTFSGKYCRESSKSKVTNNLANFNNDMSQIQCKQIYSSSNYNNNNGGAPIELLAFSHSCNVLEYPSHCPDPHGKLLKYERRLEDSTRFVHNKRKERVRKIMSWFLLVIGILLMAVALLAYTQRKPSKKVEPVKKPTFWQRVAAAFRRKNNAKTKQSTSTETSS